MDNDDFPALIALMVVGTLFAIGFILIIVGAA